MSDALVDRVRTSLRSQHYFVNDSWLKECVEYYISEFAGASLSSVEAFVTSQWLLSDLREINNERGSLPPNFSRQSKIVLPGKYIIQVDKMCDISQSKYSQIQKIRNVSDANEKATSMESPAWEPKGKRMMQMHLTDGIQDFTAIEYRPIKTLKDTLLPGFKLMIVGPVMCRKGVIMLKEENYKEIGGEVECLLKVNALENILARALSMEENENPYGDEDQQNKAVKNDNEFPEDDFDIDLDQITQIEQLSMESEESLADRLPSTEVSNPINEAANNRTEQRSLRKNYGEKAATNDRNKLPSRSSQEIVILSPVDFSPPPKRNLSPILEQKNPRRFESKISSRTELKPMISTPGNYGVQDRRNDFKNRSDIPTTSSSIAAQSSGEDYCFDLNDFEEELDEQAFKTSNPVHSKGDSAKRNNASKVLAKRAKEIESTYEPTKRVSSIMMKAETRSPRERSPTLSGGKRSADTLSPLAGSPKIICLEKRGQQLNKKNRKITEFTKKVMPKEDMPPKICDFICDVIREPKVESVTYKTVRGKVTQIDKLLKKNRNWELKATINDKTASLEIMFASQVLEELIGFTVSEFLEKKKLRKTDPEIEKYLREGFRNAEIRVQRMDVLMELELSSENEIPKVINTTEITEEQKRVIEKRMKMMAV